MSNITSEQLIQYDSKIKQYIQQQIDTYVKPYKAAIASLTQQVKDLTNELEILQSSTNEKDSTEELITPMLRTTSLLQSPMLRSISPEQIIVQEDIQEDYIIYDRVISPNEDKVYKNVVVTTDNKSNRIYFSMWYTFDNVELEDKEISIVWINADGNKGESLCVDKQLINNRLYFAWNIPGNATYKAGIIRYAIRITSDDYAWHTLPAELECVQGLVDEHWQDIIDAEATPGWVDYIEGKYKVSIQVLTKAEYDNLETKSDDTVYLVKMTDGTIMQYLGTTPISGSGGGGDSGIEIIPMTTAAYEALGPDIRQDALYLLTD